MGYNAPHFTDSSLTLFEYTMQRRTFIQLTALAVLGTQVPGAWARVEPEKPLDHGVRDRLMKSRNFQQTFEDDVILPPGQQAVMLGCLARLKRLQAYVGYGNFALLGFDRALYLAKRVSRVGAFTKEELEFMEMTFHRKAEVYGFMGEKPMDSLTGKIVKREIVKIPRTGNYLFRGKPRSVYRKICTQVGSDVVLTSGVRGMMKQFYLFLRKAKGSQGNLSMASRSLAPPGYSFHGVGDFDVGKKGYGIHNFTERFTETRVFQRLEDLGYIHFRYQRDNHLGVRFEPWHIEVT